MENSKREQILAAAVTVFERDGFRKATLDDIGVEAGASKSLIFYHYKNKFELLALMYKRAGEIMFGDMKSVFDNPELSVADKIRRAIEIHVRVAIEHQPIFRIYFRERHEIPADIQEQLIGRGERRYVAALEGVIAEGMEIGVFSASHPRTTAYSIIGACNWVTLWYRPKMASSNMLDAASIAEDIQKMVLSGILVRAPKRKKSPS
jgi:AcrR family transcriptional regulator